ncbi:MAG: C40 family peptidase [Neisseriaceae bacterium]
MKIISRIQLLRFLVCFCVASTVLADDRVGILLERLGSSPTLASEDKDVRVIREKTVQQQKADDLLMTAMGLLGVNYKWGGSNPSQGMDCSGFIHYLFKTTRDVNLPRTARMMSQEGMLVPRDKLQPGDILFFATQQPGQVSHVAVYIGNGKFIHTPRTGKAVEIRPLDNPYWAKAYLWARRINR